MDGPSELSLHEIRKFMLENGCKVTNHALVKHFKQFLTNPDTQNEARKQFKTYVNILATIKNDDNQKYLLLRKKYLHECPSEDIVNRTDIPVSPGGSSISSDGFCSPYRQPPPYKPPPEVSSSVVVKIPFVQSETRENYRDCVNEFAAAVRKIDPNRMDYEPNASSSSIDDIATPSPSLPPRNRQSSIQFNFSRENSIENEKENVASVVVSVNNNGNHNVNVQPLSVLTDKKIDQTQIDGTNASDQVENQISVKEATRKFNRMASEEEAKIISPPSKKKPEKDLYEEKITPEVTLAHPKAKEWIVSAAKANYQELAKLASEYPELVKLQDPTTGYTSLHWAAKHGNVDVVKLIAGTHKADVNARTNGGYTPLHIAMQFGKDDIFQILCNVYKADRDLMDWSGNKPLDYSKQRTTVSASTYSSEYNLQSFEKHFGNSIPVGGTVSLQRTKRSPLPYNATIGSSLARTQSLMVRAPNAKGGNRSSSHKGLDSIFMNASNVNIKIDNIDDPTLVPCLPPSDDNDVNHNFIPPMNNKLPTTEMATFRGELSKDNYGTISGRRKESFLRKKLRSASKNGSDQVASKYFMK